MVSRCWRSSQETIMMSPGGEDRVPEHHASAVAPGTKMVLTQDALSPQGLAFRKGQITTFLKSGKHGWLLVRDVSGTQCWLAAQHLQVATGADAEITPAQSMPATPTFRSSFSPEGKQNSNNNAVVGIALGLGEKNEIVVAGVKPGAPAHRSRMVVPGDHIVRIDGHPVAEGMDLKSVVQRLCGPVGSIVSLGVVKQSGDELDVVLVREQPSASLHSSLSKTPASPSLHSSMNPTNSTNLASSHDGQAHNLFALHASLPPFAAAHDHPQPQHGDASLGSAFADMNLSSGEGPQGLVYRPGPSDNLSEVVPNAPIVWPQGMSPPPALDQQPPYMPLHQMSPPQMTPTQLPPQHLARSPHPQMPLAAAMQPFARQPPEIMQSQDRDWNPFRDVPSSPRQMHPLGMSPGEMPAVPRMHPGLQQGMGGMGMRMSLPNGLPGSAAVGMGLPGGMDMGMGMPGGMGMPVPPGMGTGMRMSSPPGMGTGMRMSSPRRMNGATPTGHHEWPGFMQSAGMPGVTPTSLSRV